MRFQTREAAAWGDLKLFIGVTPGRLFQRATRRVAGQPATSSASSCSLPKLSKGVVVGAMASAWPATAVMLFCSSTVKIVISFSLSAALCAVTTLVTRNCLKGKTIVRQSDDGETVAMRPPNQNR